MVLLIFYGIIFSLAYFTVATFNLSLVDIHICTFADIQFFHHQQH